MKALLHDGEYGYKAGVLPMPEVEEGTVIVRVKAVGICRSHIRKHGCPLEQPETVPDGYEVAGEIVEIGRGVRGWHLGDRVAVDVTARGLACGKCVSCRIGRSRWCVNRIEGWGGGFAEYMKRKARGCYLLPKGLSWQVGALTEPFAVAIHGLRRGSFTKGDSLAVLGSGTIGLATIATARHWGTASIVATAKHALQAEVALALGADEVFNVDTPDLEDALVGANGGVGPDVVVEAVGGTSPDTIRTAIELARPMGKVVVLGGFLRPIELDLIPPLVDELSMVFAHCYHDLPPPADFQLAIDTLNSGQLPFERIVTHTFGFDQVDDAFVMASRKSKGAIKVQFAP